MAYPIQDIATITDSPEIQKEVVNIFLNQIKEALRVAKTDIRINPWSTSNFYELFGVKTVTVSNYDEIGILAINFEKLFSEMGLTTTIGEIYNEGFYSQSWRNESIILEKTEAFSIEPLNTLIRLVESSEKPLLIKTSDILANEPADGDHPISQCLRALKDWQGHANESQKQNDTIKNKTHNGNLYLNNNQEQIAIEVFGQNNPTWNQLSQSEIALLLLKINQHEIDRCRPNIDEQKENLKSLLSPIISSQFIN